jgi:hypothetical protein
VSVIDQAAPGLLSNAVAISPAMQEGLRMEQENAAARRVALGVDRHPPMHEVFGLAPRPPGVSLVATGSWRVYFHRLNPDGLPWCVSPDSGAWEIAVRNVVIGASSTAVYRPKERPDDEDGRPSAWIAVTGTLTVCEDGLARTGQ